MADSPPTQPTLRRHASHRRRLSAAMVMMAAVASVLVAGPVEPAAAAGNRRISTSLSCTSTTLTVGTPVTCTLTVSDNESGIDPPDGTVAWTVNGPSNLVGSALFENGCTQTVRQFDDDDLEDFTLCSVTVLPMGIGTPQIRASFTPLNEDQHRSGTRDRNLTVNSSGSARITGSFPSQTTGSVGLSYKVALSACPSGSNRQAGLFVSFTADPNTTAGAADRIQPTGFFGALNAWGARPFEVSITAENANIGRTYARWYCSNGAATSPSAANVTYLSPLFTYDVPAPAALGGVSALRSASGALVGTSDRAGWSVDPDALPAVDTVALGPDQVAQLKQRVDAVLPDSGRVTRLATVALGTTPDRVSLDRWTQLARSGRWASVLAELRNRPEFIFGINWNTDAGFVQRAVRTALGRAPSAAELDAMTAGLRNRTVDRIGLLAQLVETPESVARTEARTYVFAAYQALARVVPTPAELDRFTSQYGSSLVRSDVVEDIALSRATSTAWATALAGPQAATVRF
jgi:hypothetical protein